MKTALITGITGMDGSHMADLLLSKGYQVFGLERHNARPNRNNIKHIEDKIQFVRGDLTDFGSIMSAIRKTMPNEIYNFGAQTFDGDSWITAEMTTNVNALGVTRLLEASRLIVPLARIHQASSSAMYGNTSGIITEENRLNPHSPYASAKVFAHHLIKNYRDTYKMFACSSICFTHESERRGIEFVTRKISDGVARIIMGLQDKIQLGNLDSERDWGYAPDYVEGIWRMMQQDLPDDYIFATGETHSVKEFIQEAFKQVGIVDWENYISIDSKYIRKAEIHKLTGNSLKARTFLNWKPLTTFKDIVAKMVKYDINLLKHYE